MEHKPKLLVFASGGGSGFEQLVIASRNGTLNVIIVGVISNKENAGVRARAERLGIPFIYHPGPWTAETYQKLIADTGADFVALSGWLKLGLGFDSRKTVNIHPGLLPEFGGKGMYGHYVHEAAIAAYKRGEITHSGLTMHFVDEEFDKGCTFFKFYVKILPDDTALSLGARVNMYEHKYQAFVTNLVVTGQIYWDGVNKDSLVVPEGYKVEQYEDAI